MFSLLFSADKKRSQLFVRSALSTAKGICVQEVKFIRLPITFFPLVPLS
jgi:hypothetical protein